MVEKQLQEKGILAKLLEKGIEILLKKECKNISKITVIICSSSTNFTICTGKSTSDPCDKI